MKELLKRTGFWIRNILLLLFVLSLFFVLLYKYLPVHYTSYLFWAKTEQWKGERKEGALGHQWTPLGKISQNLTQAVIAAEDNLFLLHNGFDYDEDGGVHAELGTISQQTARNVFLWPKRSWVRKLLETYFTALIEFVWGKERIMEVYLNSVEMKEGLFGAQALSQSVFGKDALELTPQEAALIAVSISDPKPHDLANPSAVMLKKQAKILSLMDKIIPVELGNPVEDQDK